MFTHFKKTKIVFMNFILSKQSIKLMIRVGNIKEVQPKYWCHHFVFYQKDFMFNIMREMGHSLSLPSFVDIREILSSKILLLSPFFLLKSGFLQLNLLQTRPNQYKQKCQTFLRGKICKTRKKIEWPPQDNNFDQKSINN